MLNLLLKLVERLLILLLRIVRRISGSSRSRCAWKEKEDGKDWQTRKLDRIQRCLQQNPINLWELRELALSKGGLMNSQYRQQAWPLLVGLDDVDDIHDSNENENEVPDLASPTSVLDLSAAQQHFSQPEDSAEVELIRRDVGRSVIFQYNNYYHDTETPSFAGERLATVLESLIVKSPSSNNSNLHYYQGLHDVVGVLLHHLDYQTRLTTKLVQTAVAQSHFRDAMRENFGNITWLLTLLMLPLVQQIDKHVHYALALSGVELSTLCLPWVITWFTHDVFHPPTAARLADAFLAGHPLLPFYVAVALLTHPILKQELLLLAEDENNCDPATMFVILKKLPMAIVNDDDNDVDALQRKVTVQELLEDALVILKKYPPRSLLDLVDADFEDLLHRVSSISAFRTPNAWRITSGKKMNFHPHETHHDEDDNDSLWVHAKLASGIPILHLEIPDSIVNSQTWGSQRYRKKKGKRRLKWKQYTRRTRRIVRTIKSKILTT